MSYPLTGAALSGGTTVAVRPAPRVLKVTPTRVSGAIPLSGYARSVKARLVVRPAPRHLASNPNRQWGLAPTFEVISDSWGIF